MSDLGAYARLYLCIPDDPKFAEVYDNDHHFATYCRLLMIAEGPWPASAHIPAVALPDSVEKLAVVGLIDLQPGGRYRIHGLDAERQRRSANARNAAAVRWQSDRNATAVATGMPSRAKQSKDEQSSAVARDPADIYWELTGRYPADKTLAWVDDLSETYGREATALALAAAFTDDQHVGTLLGRTKDRLGRHARQLDIAEREQERVKVAEQRRVNVPLLLAAHNNGRHEATGPVDGCTYCKSGAA